MPFPAWPEFAPTGCNAPPVPGGSSAGPPAPIGAAEAEAACNAIAGPDRKENCKLDVAATGTKSFADAYRLTEKLAKKSVPTEPELHLPANFSENLARPIEFAWNRSDDRDGGVTYRHCIWGVNELFDYSRCKAADEPLASRDSLIYGGSALLALLALLILLFFTLLRNRPALLALVALLLLPLVFAAFYLGRSKALDVTVAQLSPGQAYLWKVIAEDRDGAIAESETRRLTVR